MTFAHPYFLLLLLLLPLAAWLRGKRGNPASFIYSSVQLVRPLLNITRTRSGGLMMALRWLTLIVLIVAMAQPRITRSESKTKASGVDIVAAIDLSGSMISEDFVVGTGRLNRLAMLKEVLKGFIEKRSNDRIGLVAFATKAYIAAPLTLDHDFLLSNLARLEIGAIEENQTAIGSGLSTAVNKLRDLESKSKIVILMTDGQNNAGKISPMAAAEAAQALKVKVYTIGVGSQGTAPFPVIMNGRKVGYRQMAVDIDEDTLRKIAEATGGRYYRADNAQRFQSIYAEIDKLEKTEREMTRFEHHRELFAWLIVPGLGLLLLESLLRHTIWRKLP
jgi:Ca-activated chloride channel family protein